MVLLQIIDIYSFIVLASVVVSWLQLPADHPVIQLLDRLVEPVLRPIRQVIPPTGGLDFAPIVLLLGLQLLRRLAM